jgi:hypothetical protein
MRFVPNNTTKDRHSEAKASEYSHRQGHRVTVGTGAVNG